jgi:hypothetical protein
VPADSVFAMAGVFLKCNGSMVSSNVGEQVSVIGRVIKVPVNDMPGIVEAAVRCVSLCAGQRRGFVVASCAIAKTPASLPRSQLTAELPHMRACAQDGVQVQVWSSEDTQWNTCVREILPTRLRN